MWRRLTPLASLCLIRIALTDDGVGVCKDVGDIHASRDLAKVCHQAELLWSEINDPLGLACRSFDLARFINHNLDTKPDHGANVRREQLPLSIACGLIGMTLTCLHDDAHVIEASVAPQFDQEMRSKA